MIKKITVLNLILFFSLSTFANVKVEKTERDLEKSSFEDSVWKGVHEETISLMAQPMITPKPKKTETASIRVQALQDGKSIAFRLKWKAPSASSAGKLGAFSDAVALQFAIKDHLTTPIMMGDKEHPVHIFHWRYQYQKDHEQGKPEVTDIYPNMNPDMYPMEFKDPGKVKGLDDKKREVYSPGKASGNPQSYAKSSAVDEILAEGFGSSSVVENKASIGHGFWANGEWTVTISRLLKRENGSTLEIGKNSGVAFAVWQGKKQEVGSRKSLSIMWVPLTWKEEK